MASDLRLAVRALLKSPAFALTTILVLALGIGANTAIFGLVNQVLLNPPGISDPERMVALRARYLKLNMSSISVSQPDVLDVERSRDVFPLAAAGTDADLNFTGAEVPERLLGGAVSVRWFDVFGARPLLGRTFRAEEDQPNGQPVTILAHGTWMRLFGGDPAILGRTIPLDQKPYKVIGVMAPDFRWPREADLWVPLALPREEFTEDHRFHEHLTGVARLAPGVSFEQAAARVKLLSDRLRNSGTENGAYAKDSEWGMFLLPMTTYIAGPTRTPMLVLLGAVGLVLLIACANIAGLMLARTASRINEVALRAALGASRWQLIRSTLAEALVLTACGGMLGLGLAYLGMQLVLLAAPERAVVGLAARIDLRVLLFTATMAIGAGLLFSLAPAWQAWRTAPAEYLKAGGRSGASGRVRHRLRATLVVGETALALVLLVGAGLLLRSFARLQEVDPGFDPRDLATTSLSLPEAQYKEREKTAAFYQALTDRLATLPGVTSAALGFPLPFGGNDSSASFDIEGRTTGPGDPGPHGHIRLVTPGYFAAMRIPVKRGRVFEATDRLGTAPVVVIDENLAAQYWPHEDPIGRHMRNGSRQPWSTIVGVVGHVRHGDLSTDDSKGTYYYCTFQQPERMSGVVVRTRPGTPNPARAIREAIRALDPSLPVDRQLSMGTLVANSLAARRFVMQLLAFFAAVALLTAALGLYGVVSYAVAQRTQEIGVRMALGAGNRAVLQLIMGQGLRMAALGVAIGLVAATSASLLLRSLLFNVSPIDPMTFGAMVIILLGATLVAAYLPARRASRVDPLVALRYE